LDKHFSSVPALLTREQAANYLGVKTSTLAVWACTKRYNLPFVKIGRLCKYRLDVLEEFVERNTICKETLQ
jgi:excisionase family DNA binding protein